MDPIDTSLLEADTLGVYDNTDALVEAGSMTNAEAGFIQGYNNAEYDYEDEEDEENV